ncbi:MAG: glycosyl hydrolase family 28 protein [Bacteroidota bacterium]|nr:glycosyl hydrolase family 28 protein [Bacteroidota bacterium]
MKETKHSIFTIILGLLCIFQFVSGGNLAQSDSVNQPKISNVLCYTYPRLSPKSTDYKVRVNNKDIFVYSTSAAPFAAFACDGPVTVEIEMPNASKNVTVSPLKNGIKTVIDGNHVRFQLPKPMSVAVEVNGMPQLYIYANLINSTAPSISDSNVKYFKAGQVYEVGELKLKDNETLYIEGGAVVRGCIRASSAKNVRITGSGILDGGYYHKGIDEERSIVFKDCKNALIENIIMIEPSSWMIVLGSCQNVTVQNVKELGTVSSTDGVDIVGSKKIRINNCFFRNGDDCVAIKALDMGKYGNFSQDVEDVEVRGCSFISYSGGQALEIGHELRTASVRNIRFTDCDILGVHGFGGVFGIHNSDRALISNILYENIRVEHYYDKLIDMRIIKSRYFQDQERGQVLDIVFRNITVTLSPYNPGYSISTIGGYDANHLIQDVTFDNFMLNGVKVLNGDQLDLFTKQTANIKFK